MKQCPFCKASIPNDAVKCQFCGEWVTNISRNNMNSITGIYSALATKYEISEEIGRGGMAIVFKAIQKNLGRIVALKVINQNLVNDSEFLSRFHREAQLVARLNHSNIVHVYDEGIQNGYHYMAMEFLNGINLYNRIQKEQKLSIPEVITIGGQIANALQHAHSHGIIHRDIKSSNIIITQEGRAVLLDFGIAYAAFGLKLTKTGTIFGTPEYMSPEQAQGEKVDYRTDIYSLGVVLFECLSGHSPFKGDNPITIIHKVIHEVPPLLSDIRPDIPVKLARVINKALAKNPEQRYASAVKFAQELEQAGRAFSSGMFELQNLKDNTETLKINARPQSVQDIPQIIKIKFITALFIKITIITIIIIFIILSLRY